MGEIRSSPMLEQYRKIKHNHQNDVLFFRLGDFYEMFAEDAVEVSGLLNLTLTSRNGLPMCGIPYHASHSYIARLLKIGKKIAVCEQVSLPEKGQKIIDRKVVEVITPGTTVDEDYLDRGNSNYLACLSMHGEYCSFAYIDLSTGGFYATSFSEEQCPARLGGELERLQVKEMLIQESLLQENPGIARIIHERPAMVLNRWADWLFDMDKSRKLLLTQFRLSSLKSFGLEDNSPELLSAGAILEYINDTAKSVLLHVRSITVYTDDEFVGIDESSQRNLELVRNLHDGSMSFSLFEVLDETRSAMGKRLLRRRLLHPLLQLDKINKRLDMVETLFHEQGSLGIIRQLLAKIPDIERLVSRLAMDKAHGKDMLAIKDALALCTEIKKNCDNLNIFYECDSEASLENAGNSSKNKNFHNDYQELTVLETWLKQGICDDPSILLTEGNLIRKGYNAALDELHSLRDSGRQLLEAYLEEEKQANNIPNLKIRYNRLIGYFFEVTNAYLGRVPKYFIRRQGIVGGERYSTERLANMESDINGASDKIIELEKKIFLEIREKAKEFIPNLTGQAHRIAELDAAQSLAWAASIHHWVRPSVDDSNELEIYLARHPVVETHLGKGEFIPNDIILGNTMQEENGSIYKFAMITGPNMAGKSTYLRSAALLVIMAQIGSFIPAGRGRIGLCDKIYCRVGASDNLARGESTFLVEMNETAYILNTASEKSLVIMDEVGRGTSTNDGLSIAWAVCEELLNRVQCRTFFATHYHELSLLQHPYMVNRSMKVLEKDGGIIFLRQLQEGPAAESYGIHVASLAGLSQTVLHRAAEIMEQLRKGETNLKKSLPAENYSPKTVEKDAVIHPFGQGNEEKKVIDSILHTLEALDTNTLTPLEALNVIDALKKQLKSKEGIPIPKEKSSKHSNDTLTPSLF